MSPSPPGSEPGLHQHLRFLPQLPGPTPHQGHVQVARLPGHRRGDGGTPQGGQESGEEPRLNPSFETPSQGIWKQSWAYLV